MQDILRDIHQYNHQLTISQLVTFFERKGVKLTKSMVQNYVRDGLLPPPLGKRYYTHGHLAALALISELKGIYEMAEIKAAMLPLMDNEGLALETYRQLSTNTEEMMQVWQKTIAPLSPNNNAKTLLLMTHSADLKNLALLEQDLGVWGETSRS